MKRIRWGAIAGTAVIALASSAASPASSSAPAVAAMNAAPTRQNGGVNWPSFRGPGASGIAEGHATATTWNGETGENVLWKTPIPGLSHSSPVVWGDLVFLTTAISGADNSVSDGSGYGDITPVRDDSEHVWKVYALDKNTGAIVWEHTAHTGVPAVMRHTRSSHASATVATDGSRVIAYFGSEGLYAFDMDGEPLWNVDFGVLDAGYYVVPGAQWSVGSSPIIWDGKVILQADIQEGSFLAAFDVEDGREIWRTERDEVPTWGTPNVVAGQDGGHVVVNGYRHIGAYDADTGREIWRMSGGGDIPVPTPVFGSGLIFITNAHGPLSPIYAIRPEARGDITVSLADGETSNEYVAWSVPRSGAYMVTPIVYRDWLYNLRNNGVLLMFDPRTGERMYQERLGGGGFFTASPVAADGKVYFAGEDGDVYVVAAGPEFELLASNPMGEMLMATPAISEGMLLLRTLGNLVAIAAPGR
jgi:outer membrane protein assembly factor BamB